MTWILLSEMEINPEMLDYNLNLLSQADEKMDKEYKRTTMITEDTIKKKVSIRYF